MLHLHQSWKKSKQHSHFSQATDARSICHQPGTCRGEPGPEVSPHAHSYLQGQASPKGASREPAQCLRTQGCSMVLRAESVQSSSATPKEVGYDGEEIPLGQAPSTSPACSFFGRGWCPAARTRPPSSTSSRARSWQTGMSVWHQAQGHGDMTPPGLGRSLPQHHTGTVTTGTGILPSGQGMAKEPAGSRHGVVLQTPSRLPPPLLACGDSRFSAATFL